MRFFGSLRTALCVDLEQLLFERLVVGLAAMYARGFQVVVLRVSH